MSRSHSGRSILFAYLGIAIPGLIGVALVPVLLRNLGSTRFGLLSMLLSVAAFFMNFDFGMGPALARYTSRLSARPGSLARVRRLVRSALIVQSALGCLTTGALYAGLEFVGYASARYPDVSPTEFAWGAALMALATPFALLTGGTRASLEGLGRFGLANTLRSVASASTFALPIALSFFSTRVDVMMLGLLVARVLTAAIFWVALRSIITARQLPLTARYVKRVARSLLAYGGWVMVGAAAGGLITLGVLDRLFIARLVGASAVVRYSVPSDIVVRCLLAPAAITSVLLPLFAHTVTTRLSLDLPLRRSAALVMGQMGPLSLLLVLNAEWILRLLLRDYADGTSVVILQAMAVGLFVHSVAHVPYAALHALGRPNYASSRHLLELPLYAVASILAARVGAVWFLGFLWAGWALIDLWLIGWLLGLARHGLRLRAIIGGPRFVAWLVLLVLAAVISRQGGHHIMTVGLSFLAIAYGAYGTVSLLGRNSRGLVLSQ